METTPSGLGPATDNRTVPLRRPNADLWTREHLLLCDGKRILAPRPPRIAGLR
jgi:hypothetical protein